MKYPLLFILAVLGLISSLVGWIHEIIDDGITWAYTKIDEKL